MLVDAHSGVVVFKRRWQVKNRVVYDHASNTTLGLPGPYSHRRPEVATGITDVDLVYEYGGFYDFLQASCSAILMMTPARRW
ncbi:MAG: hypothetical protein R2911_30775 [Caldilineaceae bacterium]